MIEGRKLPEPRSKNGKDGRLDAKDGECRHEHILGECTMASGNHLPSDHQAPMPGAHCIADTGKE